MSFDPYMVLGEAREVSFETLRASYRRLVRENHPDVAQDKTVATVRMAQINEAWRLIGDPQKRAAFDAAWRQGQAERENQQRKAREKAARARVQPERVLPKRATSPNSPSAPRGRSSDKKLGRSGVDGKNSRPSRDMRLMHQVLVASQLFHRERKTKEAIALCRQVLLADGRNVAARELMGDIFAHQGHFQYALMMFDQAIQIAPEDQVLRRKRDMLERAQYDAQTPQPKKVARPTLWNRLRSKLSGG
jgi:curved DNA-binding protein CbpA